VTVSNHGYLGYAVIVNKKFWDGLPADIRTSLETAMRAEIEDSSSLKGTLASVFFLGIFLVVTWVSVYFLFLDRF
jgi:hypothetical protein